jgi:hypothetical protein
MNTKPTVTLICFLMPLLAEAATLDIYGELIGKNILRPSNLPRIRDSIISDLPADKTKAIAMFDDEFARSGIAVVQDGPHFVRLLGKEEEGYLLTNAPLRGAELRPPGGAAIPPGTMNIASADLDQVLRLYASLSQRTVLRPAILPRTVVNLKTQFLLTREESVYALETVLALNGICVVEDGASFAQVVPMAQRAAVKPGAPKPEPAAALFYPDKAPSKGVPDSKTPLAKPERTAQELARLKQAFYDFMHAPDPRSRSPQRLLELYGCLADKKAVPSRDQDGTSLWFQIQTPLSKSELLYAIETTLTLNNFLIVPVDDQGIRLGHVGELEKGSEKRS